MGVPVYDATHGQDVIETCTSFSIVNGRQECKATTTQRRDRVIPVSGTLRLTRIAVAPAQRVGNL